VTGYERPVAPPGSRRDRIGRSAFPAFRRVGRRTAAPRRRR
jgi:hypothetical protein